MADIVVAYEKSHHKRINQKKMKNSEKIKKINKNQKMSEKSDHFLGGKKLKIGHKTSEPLLRFAQRV